jgi:predicted NBD/HSP70 family sugar kinase
MRIGIDLGGTKIEAALLDGRGRIRLRRRVPTPRADYAATLAAIAGLVRLLEAAAGRRLLPVGVGHPGAFSAETGSIKNANSTCLIGKPFDKDLREALGRPVKLANDADCLALSEAVDGAAAGAEVVFGVILGTGVGGGVVVRGRLLQGPNGIAGEWGHNPLPSPRNDERPGPLCYCGRRGCIETFLCGPALERDYQRRAGRIVSAARVAELASRGEGRAKEVIACYEDRLARALAVVINIIDPHVIVLGGGVSNIARLYRNVPRLWRKPVFSDRVRTRLVRAKHGDSSGVRGAAWLNP